MGLSARSFIVTYPEHEEHRIFQKVVDILAEITSRMPKIFRSWQAGRVRALIQRVEEAAVDVVDGDSRNRVGSIGRGLCVLVGVTHDDTTADAERIAEKISHLRVFDDDDGVMNLSATEIGAELLIVSQFTLYGNTSKGRRPSWIAAAPPAFGHRSRHCFGCFSHHDDRHGRVFCLPGPRRLAGDVSR